MCPPVLQIHDPTTPNRQGNDVGRCSVFGFGIKAACIQRENSNVKQHDLGVVGKALTGNTSQTLTASLASCSKPLCVTLHMIGLCQS